ncbi:MAG: hypothetical protein JJU41_11620 [Bacteroidetes bacterium]|nr:hypothetical protein [Bacteroidota bacterium]
MAKTSSRRKTVSKPIEVKDFWSNLSVWKQHTIVILILLSLPAILHSPVFFGGQQFATHDIIQWRAGAESLMQHREEYGEQAQWSTNMFAGMPAYVISNLERFPQFDTVIMPLFRGIFPLVEYWILITGAYFFLLLMGFRPLVSATGAIIIAFTTYIPIIVGAGHNTKFIAYAYIPWVFAGFRIMMNRPDKLLAGFALFLFAFMMHIRAGHPQVTYYFLFLMGIWWIFEGVDAYREKKLTAWTNRTLLLAGAGFLAAFSVLEQYWSVYDYSQYSIRGGSEIQGTSGLPQDYAFVWSQGWTELLTLIAPNLFGGGELYWGPKPVTSGPHYFGGIATLLLIIGLVLVRKPHNRIFLTTALLAILFSLGKHFSLLNEFMFNYFPLFNKFRTPEMWLMLAVFCLTVPAMDGLQYISEKAGNLLGKPGKGLTVAGVIVGISFLAMFATSSMLSYEKPNERAMIANQLASQNQVSPQDPRVVQATNRILQEQFIPERKSKARADVVRYVLLASAGAFLLWLLMAGKIAPSIVLIAIIGLTAFDMISVGKRYIPDSAYSPGGLSVVEVIERQKRPVDTWLQTAIQTDEPWTYRVFPLGDNPFNNAIPSFFYPSIGGYTGARMSIFDEIQVVINQSLDNGDIQTLNRILSMLNVKYVTFGGQFPGYRVAFSEGNVIANENPDVMPKAWFADRFYHAPSAREALNAVTNPEIDLSTTAIVQRLPEIQLQPDSLATLQITRYNAHHIDLSVNRLTDGFLVLSEMFYPGGWNARINGEPVEIIRTNFALRGVEVPAGNHEIEFYYSPSWYATVRWISNIANMLAMLIILAGIVMYSRKLKMAGLKN